MRGQGIAFDPRKGDRNGCIRFRTEYVPGQGYFGYFPGHDEPMAHWGDEFLELVKEQAQQNAANKTESVIPPNAPAPYDPSEAFERRELTEDELNELANKYDPTNMTREEYDSFLDDLVEQGILSKNELGPLGYHGFITVGSLAEGGTGLTGGSWAMDQPTVEKSFLLTFSFKKK